MAVVGVPFRDREGIHPKAAEAGQGVRHIVVRAGDDDTAAGGGGYEGAVSDAVIADHPGRQDKGTAGEHQGKTKSSATQRGDACPHGEDHPHSHGDEGVEAVWAGQRGDAQEHARERPAPIRRSAHHAHHGQATGGEEADGERLTVEPRIVDEELRIGGRDQSGEHARAAAEQVARDGRHEDTGQRADDAESQPGVERIGAGEGVDGGDEEREQRRPNGGRLAGGIEAVAVPGEQVLGQGNVGGGIVEGDVGARDGQVVGNAHGEGQQKNAQGGECGT